MAKAKKDKTDEPPRRALAFGTTALAPLDTRESESAVLVDGFEITVNGLHVVGQPAFGEWDRVVRTMRLAEKGIQFAIGDAINALEDRFGEEAAQIVDATDWDEKTVAVYRWVAGKIAIGDRRMDRLTIKHHLVVAALTPAQQRKWLTRASADTEDRPWSVARLVEAMREGEDVPASAFWVLALATNEADQRGLMEALEAQGRSVKAVTRRIRASRQPA